MTDSLQDYYPRNFDLKTGLFKFQFNSSDFNFLNGYVTLNDLLKYANLFKSNVFSATNYFNAIFVSSINSVSKEALDYLQNVSQDVQEALNNIFSNLSILNIKTTNISYDGIATFFSLNNVFEKVAVYKSAVFSCAVGIANILRVSSIESAKINTNNLNVIDTLTSSKILMNNRPIYNYGAFIYVNGSITFPIESQFILPNTITTNSNLFFTLNKNHQIYIYLNNVLIYYFDNNSDSTIYYMNSNIILFDKIMIFYNYIPIN